MIIAILQIRLQGRLTDIEEARRKDEWERSRRALVEPKFIRVSGTVDETSFRVINHGPAKARDVQVKVESRNDKEMTQIFRLEAFLPADFPPGQEVAFDMASVMLFSQDVRATVIWRDEEGNKQENYCLYIPRNFR